MHLPELHGLIRRRLLVNFRVDAAVMQAYLPPQFFPKLHAGYAIAGICLIRLEKIRPAWVPPVVGISSENAAHRIAVLWQDHAGQSQEGVFIPRRDTGSNLNHLAGGRLFPGEHHRADFNIEDDGSNLAMSIRARDGGMSVELRGRTGTSLPDSSCFKSLSESSSFFEGGAIGYSVTHECCRLDGIRLQTEKWEVRPFLVEKVQSSFFSNETDFPRGSVTFDHALVMRDIPHRWLEEPDMILEKPLA